jgi:hypothetical protein
MPLHLLCEFSEDIIAKLGQNNMIDLTYCYSNFFLFAATPDLILQQQTCTKVRWIVIVNFGL